MKKSINKPEVKVVKLQKMNVIATSGEGGSPDGLTIQSLTTAGDNNSILFPTSTSAPKMGPKF